MPSITDVVGEVCAKLDGCLAVGVIDLGSGMILGIYHIVPHFTQAYLDAVAAAAIDMFRGKTVRRVEQSLSEAYGVEIKDSFEEIFISSSRVYHFMVVIKEKGAVVIVVTKKTVNQGMGWAVLRSNLKLIETALP
jgi:hypothetical protein